MDKLTGKYISLYMDRSEKFYLANEVQAEIDRLKEEKAELVNKILRLHRKINDGCPNNKA